MSYNLTTQQKILGLAGSGVNSTLSGSAILSGFCDDAEGTFCTRTRRDWITLSGSTLANFRGVVSETVASMAAIKAINYDMTGYFSKTEAQTMLDVLRDITERNITDLKDDKYIKAVQ